jgi:chemotaxis protein methyltransferase CheR
MKTDASPVSGAIGRLTGTDISMYNASFLDKSLRKRMSETGCGSEEAYYTLLENGISEGRHFLNSLTISYSEFFRNPLTFAVLERIIFPSLVLNKVNTKRKEIRIWSAACASGQEVYSLAMLLEERENSESEKGSYRIFATDQSEEQVNNSQKGQYPAVALNNLNLKRVSQWFSKQGDTYAVNPELKKNIDFSVFDLYNHRLGCPPSSIFGDFDLVICANLLFYYKPHYQKIIVEKAGNCLANNGYLMVGETERDILMKLNYHEVFPQSGIFQRKI